MKINKTFLLLVFMSLFLVQFALADTNQCVNGGINYSTEHTVQIDGTGTGLKTCGNGEIVTELRGHNVYIPNADNRHIIDMKCAKVNTPYGNSLINDAETYIFGINESGNFACPTHYLMTGVFYQDSGDDAVVGVECTKEVYGAGIDYNSTIFIQTNRCDGENCTANIPEGYAIWAVQSRHLTQGIYEDYETNWGIAILPIPVCCGFIPLPIPFPTGEDTSIWYTPEDGYLSGVYAAPLLPNQCVEQVCGDGRVNAVTEQCDDGNLINGDGCSNTCEFEGPVCGNGFLDESEQCDDGNTLNGDGCSSQCTVEQQPSCGDGHLDAGESCDDGNLINGDGCSAICEVELGCIDVVKEAVDLNGHLINPVPQFTFYLNGGQKTVYSNSLGHAKFTNVTPGLNYVTENLTFGWALHSVTPMGGFVFVPSGNNCATVLFKNLQQIPICGNNELEGNEQCDDGNSNNDDSCRNDCTIPLCGDGQLDAGESCDDGNNLNGDGCNAQCSLEFCGDNIVQESLGEICDDGNSNNNDLCNNQCQMTFCGDSYVNPGELCDDGNSNNDDSCRNDCTIPLCGDGFLDSNEQCDDGNTLNGDGCSSQCNVEPFCGDGNLDAGEFCDDGNNLNGDGCSSICDIESGCVEVVKEAVDLDGHLINPVPQFTFHLNGNEQTVQTNSLGHAIFSNVTPGINYVTEEIPFGWELFSVTPANGTVQVFDGNECVTVLFKNLQTIKEPVCGDGTLDDGEFCDDGNNLNGDGCDMECNYEFCGDNIVQESLGEICDDGNSNNDDLCNNQCQPTFCGDSYVNPGEICDDGNSNNDDSCRNDCTIPLCGDGQLDFGEFCDDGNTLNGDGCSAQCNVEPFCGDGNLDAGEFCDDGNNLNGDGCSAMCEVELGCIDVVKEAVDLNGHLINPVPQFTFYLNGGEQTVYSNSLGHAKFNHVVAGLNTVTENITFGWQLYSVTPPAGNVIVPEGDECVTVLFKNIQHIDQNQTNPVCGNNILEIGEHCDDGNLINGDGCSSMCHHEAPHQHPQCMDGIDNDGDGYIDLGDFSCTSSMDDDETNSMAACQDGLDNDSDGLIDLADGGCNNTQDNNETNIIISPQCSDGIDNDGDGLIDLADAGCSSASDNDESNVLPPNPTNPECNDGIDNDGDGAVDYQNDFSCTDSSDNDEGNPLAECQDGIDNDGDGRIDSADTDCINNQDNVERRSSSSGGGSSSHDDNDGGSTHVVYLGSSSLVGGQPSYLGGSSGNKILMPTGNVITLGGNTKYEDDDRYSSNKYGISLILPWILIGLIILLILILLLLIATRRR